MELFDRGQCSRCSCAEPGDSQPTTAAGETGGWSFSTGGFRLGELKISDGQIAITDDQKKQPRAVYDHIDVTLKDYAPGMPFSLELTAHLPGSGSQTFRVTGNGGPINNADIASTPFRGTLRLEEVSLSAAQTFLNKSALDGTDAVISGSTNLSNADGKMTVDGSLKLKNIVVRGVEVGYPISADFDLTDDLANDSLLIRKGAIKLGSTPVSLNGTIATRPNPAVVDVNVSATNVSIEEAARLAAAFDMAFSPNAKIAGQLTANIHAQGPTNNLAFTGNVYGRNLEVTGKQIAQPVRVPSSRFDDDAAADSVQQFHRDFGRDIAGRADNDCAIHQQLAECRCIAEDGQRQSGRVAEHRQGLWRGRS